MCNAFDILAKTLMGKITYAVRILVFFCYVMVFNPFAIPI